MPEAPSFPDWFKSLTDFLPHPWQESLGMEAQCRDRLLRIPTGFGKTAGVVLAWLYHRAVRKDSSWPMRLVFTLPMRVLVEQSERVIRDWLKKAGLEVGVHVLMGGAEAGPWALHPDRPAILLGTQDMLLSRALNRGYGAARGRWPMEFGLLHRDVLWVLDEVQLMDVGLATSTQLAALRRPGAGGPALRPSFSWWMSATLQPRWLGTVDFQPHLPELERTCLRILPAQRKDGLWEVKKTLRREAAISKPEEIAEAALAGDHAGKLTLVIANTVKGAVGIHAELEKRLQGGAGKRKGAAAEPRAGVPELRLIHSRFRGAERKNWPVEFLNRDRLPANGRILVATQVVEAGVDLSANRLITELAPWPSLVQRFGRAARFEKETAEVVVVGPVPDGDKNARPYTAAELAAADEALGRLVSRAEVSPRALEEFEEELATSDPELLQRLYPYEPEHVLRRGDLLDLFDTTPDLTGADLDVSRYIRSGDERDVTVFWRPEPPGDRERIHREELCPVPLQELREWLKEHHAWRFDYLTGKWAQVRESWRLVPGTTLCLLSKDGGYDPQRGWSPRSKEEVKPVVLSAGSPTEEAANAEDAALTRTSEASEADVLSESAWKPIALHGREAGAEACRIAQALGLDGALRTLLELAGRWHDVGKAHPVFQKAIKDEVRQEAGGVALTRELAKAPGKAWRRPAYPERPGFRHELASTLALFELLRRTKPDHPALLGDTSPVLAAMGLSPDAVPEAERVSGQDPLAKELAGLSALDFNLVAWLVCTHHGKVRCGWTSTPKDQEAGEGALFGVTDGDALPAVRVAGPDGADAPLPELRLSLACAEMGLNARYGASWRERVAGLMEAYGPFTLAWLEALLRAADVRVSSKPAAEAAP